MTVKVHRGQVMRKMGARSVPELVRMADQLTGACSNMVGDVYSSRRASRLASPELVLAADGRARANGFARPPKYNLALENQ
jgi:hypothetical protein